MIRARELTCGIAVACVAACGFQRGTAQATGGGGDGGGGGDARGGDGGRSDAAGDGQSLVQDGPRDAPVLGPRFVQSASAYASNWNNGASSIAVTFAQPVTAGNLIAIYVTYATQGSYLNTTDGQSDNFMPVDTVSDSGQQQAATDIYAANVAGGTTTVTVHFNNSPCCRVVIAHEIAGVATIDVHSSNHQGSPGTGTNAVNAGTMTTNHADYVFAGTSEASNASNQMITAGTGETFRVSGAPAGDNQTVTEDLVQSASGAVSSTFTFSKNGPALSLQMAFQP